MYLNISFTQVKEHSAYIGHLNQRILYHSCHHRNMQARCALKKMNKFKTAVWSLSLSEDIEAKGEKELCNVTDSKMK